MVITPAQLHIKVDELLRAGILATMAVGEPTIHGAVVMGIHGMGVNTPKAAAVAAATMGLAMDIQDPKGATFIMGLLSMMFAAGTLLAMVLLRGRTVKVPGAIPKEHIIMAPFVTNIPMVRSLHRAVVVTVGELDRDRLMRYASHPSSRCLRVDFVGRIRTSRSVSRP